MNSKPQNDLPFVSCLCVTFARPALLEEAIQSFLKQDYRGQKELIILNDFPLQNLVIDHPEISVINLAEQVSTLGEKRNMVAALSKGDVLFPWDDDDIHLSFRLSQSVHALQSNGLDYYKPRSAFLWNNRVIDGIEINGFHAQCCYSRELFNKVSYSAMGAGEDQDFDRRVKAMLNRDISTAVTAHENFYLYRWAGTDSYHVSSIEEDDAESALLAFYTQAANLNQIPSGTILLRPKWNDDYEALARDFVAQLSAQ